MTITVFSKEDKDVKDYIYENEEPYLITFLVDRKVRPFVIVCPGGGYKKISYSKEGVDICRWLNSFGFHAAIYCYPINDAIYPDRMLAYNKEVLNYALERSFTSQVFCMGFSAGAHLAALFGIVAGKRPNGLVLGYPVISFQDGIAHKDSKDKFLFHNMNILNSDDYSIEKNIDQKFPSTFIWHTHEDQLVSDKNTLVMIEELQKHNISYEGHIFSTGLHGLGLARHEPGASLWPKLAETWLRKETNHIER